MFFQKKCRDKTNVVLTCLKDLIFISQPRQILVYDNISSVISVKNYLINQKHMFNVSVVYCGYKQRMNYKPFYSTQAISIFNNMT